MSFPSFSAGEVLTAADMNAVGLWLVKTQAVSAGGTSVTVPAAFNANFDNYRVTWTNLGGTTGNSAFMTINGSAGSTYAWGGRFFGYAIAPGDATSGGATNSGFWLGIMGTGFSGVIDIHRPFLATPTNATAQSSGATYTSVTGSYDSNAASSTAFTITLAAGTLSAGTIRVYGYRN